jgi:CRISPR-associated protein (Cas_Cas02710)
MEDDTVLRNLLRERNSSILAHGLKPITQPFAARFLDYVDAMLKEPENTAIAGTLS